MTCLRNAGCVFIRAGDVLAPHGLPLPTSLLWDPPYATPSSRPGDPVPSPLLPSLSSNSAVHSLAQGGHQSGTMGVSAASSPAEKSPGSQRPGSVPSSSFPLPMALEAPPRAHPAARSLSREVSVVSHSHGTFFFGCAARHAVLSSLTTDRTSTCCSGSVES